jgi:hypothetical protein
VRSGLEVLQIRFLFDVLRAVTGARLTRRTSRFCRDLSRSPTSHYFIAAICLAAGLPATPSDAGPVQIHSAAGLKAAYTATLLGFPIGDITWTIDIDGNRFSATATGQTAGLLRIFAPGHGVAEAQGSIAGKQSLASNFEVSYKYGSSSDDIKIVFDDGKAKESLAHPPKPNPNLVPLTEASRTGVVDPMTALVIHVPGSGDTAVPTACERKIAVFDGHMRYDLQLAFKRIEQVKADTGYQGPAVVCAVYFTPLAGYDPTRYGIRYLQSERGMEIWLAPLTGTRLMVPFRVSVPTPIGIGILQATHFVWTRQTERSSAMNAG